MDGYSLPDHSIRRFAAVQLFVGVFGRFDVTRYGPATAPDAAEIDAFMASVA
jgi:hypothetical protein